MKVRARHWVMQLLAASLAAFLLSAVPAAWAQDGPDFSQQELDQMLAPVALYPDALLSQVLMAATYPLEVVEAERWSLANTRLAGAQAVQAVSNKDWDPSVMSLVAFPQILRMMSSKLDWTERLGDAFLGQESQVMDTVQDLRHRAYAAGNLRSNDRARIDSQGDTIFIYQADPQLAYEPYYNASVVYGSWWWPQYPPVYWAPWAGYRERPGYGSGFMWGAGISLGAQFFFGGFDWNQHHTHIVNVQNNYYPRDRAVAGGAGSTWQHNPDHRRGTPYREATVRARFTPATAPAAAARSNFRGHLPVAPTGAQVQGERQQGARNVRGRDAAASPAKPVAAPGPAGVRPGRNAPVPTLAAPAAAAPAKAPATRPMAPPPARAPTAAAPKRAAPAPAATRPHALENVGQAAEARNSSARGRDSRQAPAPAARSAPPQRAARPPAAAPAAPAARAAPQRAPNPPARAAAGPSPRAPAGPRNGREKQPGEK